MPSWESEFGRGRPGWHLECSAMSHKYLGERFDIHAGGQDLMFPHHENEIAQNYGAFGCVMANYWIHNGMLLVNGQKMSKSLGNVISLDDVLKELDGELIRYVLLSSHYQKILNWSEQAVHQAKQNLDRLYGALRLCDFSEPESDPDSELDSQDADDDFGVIEALCSNLNTPLALSRLHEISNEIYKSKNQETINRLCAVLRRNADALGVLKRENWFKGISEATSSEAISEEEIEKMIAERAAAKANKNFQQADEIRQKLLERNIKIEDTKNGTQWMRI